MENLNMSDGKLEREGMPSREDLSRQVEFVEGRGLRLKHNDHWVWVTAKASFPWTHPEEFISLVNEEAEELLMVESLEDHVLEVRKALKRSLAEAGFCFEILKITGVEERLDLREWQVETQSGPRVFHTKVSHWPTVLDNGQVFVRDLHGDIYRIIDPESLDSKSQERLSALADF